MPLASLVLEVGGGFLVGATEAGFLPKAPCFAVLQVGDTCRISLPRWVLDAGDRDPNIFFTDRAGVRNRECISLGCDELSVLAGRSPLQAYADFMTAFANEFNNMLGAEVVCGCNSASGVTAAACEREGGWGWRTAVGKGGSRAKAKYLWGWVNNLCWLQEGQGVGVVTHSSSLLPCCRHSHH